MSRPPRIYFTPSLWDAWCVIEASCRQCIGRTWPARMYSTLDLDSTQYMATIKIPFGQEDVVHPSIHLFISLSISVHLSNHPFSHSSSPTHLSSRPSIHSTDHPSMCHPIHPFIHSSVHPFVHPHLLICLYKYYLRPGMFLSPPGIGFPTVRANIVSSTSAVRHVPWFQRIFFV